MVATVAVRGAPERQIDSRGRRRSGMFDADELAGIADLFGGLDREELERACSEAAFRRGEEFDEDETAEAIDSAVETYALVEHDGLLVPGPSAFPELPEGAADLPHIMDVDDRRVDRETAARSVAVRFREAVDDAVEAGDEEHCADLLDRSYEIESWGPVTLDEARVRLDELVEE